MNYWIRMPSTKTFMAWILRLLADRSAHSLGEIHNSLATMCDFTEEQINELLPNIMRKRWHDRIAQSLVKLNEFGLAYMVGSDFYKITRMGSIVAETEPIVLDRKYLRDFPDFLQWEYRKKFGYFPPKDAPPPSLPPPTQAPPIGGRMGLIGELPTIDENLLADPRNVQVWFGTNCEPKDYDNTRMGFSNRRGKIVHYGQCVVNIPEGHKTGTTEPSVIEGWANGTKGMVVKDINGMPETDFWAKMGEALIPSLDENSLLFFLHGYNVSFLEAAIRTAQLKYDLKIPHAAFYSWPSKIKLIGYGADVASVEAATPFIANFLSRLGALTTGQKMKLHVIAHSMGNLGLLLALERILFDLKGAMPGFELINVMFAAPDVDSEKFTDYVTRTTALSQQRTLYASHKDIPLKISGIIRSAPRAGKIPPVTTVDGTDTVDVTEIDLSILGHGYVAEARPVLTDMFTAMHFGAPPIKRPGLNKSPNGKYWILS